MQKELDNSLAEFVDAVDRTSNLEIICAEEMDGKDILVIENNAIDPKLEGHQCEVDVSEIFAKVTDCKSAQAFIDVINLDRKPIVCEGVTRIVGYYSRTNNWNKSKIGELRDRAKGSYGIPSFKSEHKEETLKTIDSLS
jgi:hypothetical protein